MVKQGVDPRVVALELKVLELLVTMAAIVRLDCRLDCLGNRQCIALTGWACPER